MIVKRTKTLESLAVRYVWWNTPEWAFHHAEILLANIMNLGSFSDLQLLRREVGDERLKEVILHAPAGYFSHRSWDYWHMKFGIKPIPPLPTREFS